MSQFPSAPPPGAYVPPNSTQPNQTGFNPQQQAPQYGYQQPQASSQYGNAAPNYGPSLSSQKSSNAFGQAFDQAVKQGKPMFNKLGKTISSKLGNKQLSSTPQHLESYNSYQQHQQQHQPPTYQTQGQQQNAYASPQPQSHSQSNYTTPAYSAQPGQNSYFGQAPPPPSPNTAIQQTQANSGYNPNVFTQGDGQIQGQPPQGTYNQTQPPQPFQHAQAGSNSGQQTGVIGGFQGAPPSFNSPSPQSQNAASQPPWSSQSQPPYTAQATSPSPQQQPFSHTPPPANQQQWSPHQPTSIQTHNPTPPPLQQYNAQPPPIPVHPNQQQQQQHQWTPTSPASPPMQAHSPIPPPVSPLNTPQPTQVQQQPPISAPEPQKQSKPSTPVPPTTQPEAAPTAFIAELPADLGNLSLIEAPKPQSPPNVPAGSSYQAYRPTSTAQSPGPGFTVPRRAVSTSSIPLADPWRFADPATELPTREFYIIADLLYDAIDRKFAPSNTGLLEAAKMLESWKAVGFAEEAAELFAYDNYSAMANLWSLEEIPHVMVPCQSALMPMWNFQPQSHSEAIKIPMGSVLANPMSTTYQPALNRAGYYKYLFLELMHEPDGLDKMLSILCADTYKPGVLNQPDIQKRDRTVLHGLSAQAAAIRSACISLVSQETAARMQPQAQQQGVTQAQQAGAASPPPPDGSAPMTDEERLVQMHSLKMQSQFNHTMATTMLGGGHSYGGPNYGSLV